MTLAVYVAGASAERRRVAAFIARCREAGHEITCDWPAAMGDGPANDGLTRERSIDAAQACARGVRDAEAFVLLTPTTHTIGAWVELGIAYEIPINVLIVGQRPSSIFAVGHSYAPTEDAALEMLATWGAFLDRFSEFKQFALEDYL